MAKGRKMAGGDNNSGSGVYLDIALLKVNLHCICFPVKSKSKGEMGIRKVESPKKDDDNPRNDNKPNELPVTAVTLKIQCCQRCLKKIYKAVILYKGVNAVVIDNEKGLMTVKGKVDGKQLVESISKKLKIPVEIVPKKTDRTTTPMVAVARVARMSLVMDTGMDM